MFFRVTRGGEIVDTLGIQPLGKSMTPMRFSMGETVRRAYLAQPFSDDPLLRLTADGSAILAVDRPEHVPGTTPTFTVSRIGLDGDTTWTIRHPYTPLSAGNRIKDLWLNRQSAAATQENGPIRRRDFERALYVPAYLPPMTGVVAGADGSTWLRREYSITDSVPWSVLDSNGKMVGHILLGTTERLLYANLEHVMVLEKDELGVPYVVRYRIKHLVPKEDEPRSPVRPERPRGRENGERPAVRR